MSRNWRAERGNSHTVPGLLATAQLSLGGMRTGRRGARGRLLGGLFLLPLPLNLMRLWPTSLVGDRVRTSFHIWALPALPGTAQAICRLVTAQEVYPVGQGGAWLQHPTWLGP